MTPPLLPPRRGGRRISRRRSRPAERKRRIVRIAILSTLCLLGSFALLFAAVAVAINARMPHRADPWSLSPSSFRTERSYNLFEHRVRSIPASPRLARKVIGRVQYGSVSYPVHALRFSPLSKNAPAARAILVSGVHGNETAGVEALLDLARRIAREPRLFADLHIDIIPVVNPWGWVHDQRTNALGEDINRDFSTRRTREARIVRDFARKNGRYDLAMDLHESWKPGYFIYQYLPRAAGFGDAFAEVLARLGEPPERGYREALFTTEDGVLRIPAVFLLSVALAGRLSCEHYFRLMGTRQSYTIETPLVDAASDRIAVHRETVSAFLSRLGSGTRLAR